MYLIPKETYSLIKPLAQVELEQTSFYKRIAVLANRLGFLLAEKFFIAESKEENDHFLIWQNYINGRGNDFEIPNIEEQSFSAKTLYELIELSLEKEIEVTKMYGEVYTKLLTQDPVTAVEVAKFINIQIEAVAYYTDLCAVFEKLDKSGELTAEHTHFE